MEGAAPFLPQEIITNILKLLPVKSLIKFQCVCKDWKNLIKTPFFIAAHLHHSTQHRPCLLFNRRLYKRNSFELYLLDCEMQIVEVQNMPVVDGELQITGSSNGLLCLRIIRNGHDICPPPSFLLWNPAFREVRLVPTTFPGFEGWSYIGFGFSPIVNDYKIVRIYNSTSDDLVVEVYSLGIGSWKKKIDVGNLKGLIPATDVGFTMNGAIFWLGFKREDHEYVIISFDIDMEVFALIPVPSTDITVGVSFTEFEHRLTILCPPKIENSESSLLELWVLEEATFGSRGIWSWTKKYASNSSPALFLPETIWRNEIAGVCHLWPEYGRPELMTGLSNLTSNELKVLLDGVYSVFNYVESLVPVSNIHIEES